MDIRLIAMDLDGTSLQRDHSTFSPRLLAALETAYAKGITVVPVTGRQFGLLPPVFETHHPWAEFAVLSNGGQIRNLKTGEIHHNLNIDPMALEQLLALAEEYRLPIEFSVDSTLYLTQESYDRQLSWPDLAFHCNTILARNGCIVPSLVPLCGPEVEKVNLFGVPREVREAVEQRLQSVAVSAVWSSANSLEITHPDATKGQALQTLCRMLEIPMEAVMALGDSGNDITMLRRAGLGVAMGNAPDFVKEAADVSTGRYDADGAAKAIEQYVLGKRVEEHI